MPHVLMPGSLQNKGNKRLELRKLCVDENELAAHKTFRVVLGTLQISKNAIICLCSKPEWWGRKGGSPGEKKVVIMTQLKEKAA